MSICTSNAAAAPNERAAPAPSETATDATPAPASEGADAGAQAAFAAGLEASRAERWEDAEREFRRSASLVRRQSTLYNWSLSLYMVRRFRECLVVLDQVFRTTDGSGDPRYVEYANELSKRVRSELSTVRLIVDPPNANVRIDGETAREMGAQRSIEVLPGVHDVEVSARQYVTQRISITTTAGVDFARSVKLEHVQEKPSPDIRPRAKIEAPPSAPFVTTTAPWIAIGLGGTLLAAGVVTGALALKADDELAQKCPATKNCDPSLRSDQDRALSLGRVTDVLLLSGGVFLVGGVAWRLLVPVPAASGNARALFLGASGHF